MTLPNLPTAKSVVSGVAAIILTGWLLKVAGEGKLGEAMQRLALAVTKGYGTSA